MSDRLMHTRQTIDHGALAQLFLDARTHNAFLDIPVSDAKLREATDIAKIGPTSVNQSPLRVLFLKTSEARERLRPALAAGNVDKTMADPIVAIAGYDVKFYEHLPFLFPHADAKPWFSGNEAFA